MKMETGMYNQQQRPLNQHRSQQPLPQVSNNAVNPPPDYSAVVNQQHHQMIGEQQFQQQRLQQQQIGMQGDYSYFVLIKFFFNIFRYN